MTYKKAPAKLENAINSEAKNITKNLELSDRINYLARSPAYITLKDHKENFSSKATCRLINPAKSEIGKMQQKYNRKNKFIATRKIEISTMEEHQCSYKMFQRYQQQR